jgi:hypothetical protein
MNAARPLPVDGSGTSGDAGFIRALARRFNPRTLAVGTLIAAALVIVGGMGLVGQVWDAPLQTKMARLVETAVAGIVIFIAVLVADELTERGAPRAATTRSPCSSPPSSGPSSDGTCARRSASRSPPDRASSQAGIEHGAPHRPSPGPRHRRQPGRRARDIRPCQSPHGAAARRRQQRPSGRAHWPGAGR